MRSVEDLAFFLSTPRRWRDLRYGSGVRTVPSPLQAGLCGLVFSSRRVLVLSSAITSLSSEYHRSGSLASQSIRLSDTPLYLLIDT